MKLSFSFLAKACFRFSSLVLLVGGLFTSAQATTNLIANGDFESTTSAPASDGTFGDSSEYTNLPTGATFVDNWTYSGTNAAAAYTRDALGNHFIQMGAGQKIGGILTQSFDASANQTYDVSFSLRAIGTGSTSLTVSVSDSFDNILGSKSVTLSDASAQSFSFNTGTNATGLKFTITDTTLPDGASNDNDLGIDNVSVTQNTSSIPEPSTYAAIFGVLALGAAAYRRRLTRA